MDSTAANTTAQTVQQLIYEALKQSPNNPASNGYGYALAVVLSVGVLCIAGFVYIYRQWNKYRDQQDAIRSEQWREEVAARKEAREKLTSSIDNEFDKLKTKIDNGLDKLDTKLGSVEDKYQDQDKQLILLKYRLDEFIKKDL